MRRLRMTPKPFREGEKLAGQQLGHNWLHRRALACGFCQGSLIAAPRPRLRGSFHQTGISLWMGRHGKVATRCSPRLGQALAASFPVIFMLTP
jgi:hypothetical protein